MKKLTYEDILSERKSAEESLKSKRHPVSLMLHNIRSLYNVGSIFRTADSAMLSELILCGFTPHPPRKEIEKTELGAVDSVPWNYEEDIFEAVRKQKSKGVKVIALELTNKKRQYTSLEEKDYPLCLVLGNELVGIDNEVLNACDDAVEIPMFGVKHSLNVSVSAGIAAYEAIRKWETLNK